MTAMQIAALCFTCLIAGGVLGYITAGVEQARKELRLVRGTFNGSGEP